MAKQSGPGGGSGVNLPSAEDKEMMYDVATTNSRIFIGRLPVDQTTKQNLVDLFKEFGPIKGALVNRGFGFVQFDNEQSARDAIAQNNRMYFRGKKIDVKAAKPAATKPPRFGPPGKQAPSPSVADNSRMERDRSPIMQERDGYHHMGYDKGREPTRFPSHPLRVSPSNVMAPPMVMDKNCDCEIIVMKRENSHYAEYVEERLKSIGMSVDVLFPKEDCSLLKILTNIASRGCIFAIVIYPQNEDHRSITLNILVPPQQEHRNMPLNDALSLITRTYDSYLQEENNRKNGIIPSSVAPLNSQPHPDNMQVLLNLLVGNKTVTVLQYDKIISYLQEKREVQLKAELGETALPPTVTVKNSTTPSNQVSAVPASAPPPTTNDKQAELQSRILSILNTKSSTSSPQTPTPTNNRPPIMSDPTVQKALSGLFQGKFRS